MALPGNIEAVKKFTFGTGKTWAAVDTITVAEQSVTVPGIRAGDFVLVQKPTHQAGLGYNSLARCATDGTLVIIFYNPTVGGITPTAAESWSGMVIRAENSLAANAYV